MRRRILRNAILGKSPRAAASARSDARASARALRTAHAAVRLVVARRGTQAARSLLNARSLHYRTVRAGRRTTFLIDVARNAGGDDLPWTRALAADLRRTACGRHVPRAVAG